MVPRFAVARYGSGGRLDAHFGSGGKTLIDVSRGSDIAYGLAQRPTADSSWWGTRTTPAATTGGSWVSPRREASTPPSAPADGSSRRSDPPSSTPTAWPSSPTEGSWWSVVRRARPADFCVLRYRASGSLDLTFGGDGKVFTDLFGPARTRPVAWPCRRTEGSWWRAKPFATAYAGSRWPVTSLRDLRSTPRYSDFRPFDSHGLPCDRIELP